MVTIAPTAPTATRLRLTVRGRRVLTALVALPVAAAIAAAVIAGGGSALASRAAGAPAGTYPTVTVSAGDSLWSIAERIAPQADPRDVVDAIVQLNALDGVGIAPGNRLSVPLEYAPER
mgnify:CR=1 FL=1